MAAALGVAEAAIDDDEDGVDADDALVDPLEPHAAIPNAALADRAAMAPNLYFTGTPSG
jgi:hypothetical protein